MVGLAVPVALVALAMVGLAVHVPLVTLAMVGLAVPVPLVALAMVGLAVPVPLVALAMLILLQTQCIFRISNTRTKCKETTLVMHKRINSLKAKCQCTQLNVGAWSFITFAGI
jgi:hypothetical protein